MRVLLGFLVALALSACAHTATLTPSELNAHADSYDGKTVSVRGWLVHQFENIGIWNSKEAYDAPVKRAQTGTAPGFEFPDTCISYSGPDLGRHFVSRMVVLKGTFRKHILPPGVFSNGICNETGLEVTSGP